MVVSSSWKSRLHSIVFGNSTLSFSKYTGWKRFDDSVELIERLIAA